MKPGDGKRRRTISPEERVLWTTVTKSIVPLRESAAADESDEAKALTPARHEATPAKHVATAPLLTNKKSPPPLSPLGSRTKQRVARGKESIDGRLDLHGLTQSEAHATLLRFLRTASSREARLVLVITGKGGRDGERGVLKRQVPQWLSLPEFRAFVVGFEDAHRTHGGEGALYLRIRRVRSE